eukprot:TRINITY_DN2390_c0_g1_i2.p1 TRINITY_DN2390_c0_g1~~TRINITY_DN2390_c0_g1_i2.p1  ORF type:complete len:292 (+),score=35.25 TRINITY_DN2390_c0_g1_i2:234-1109(+)
MKPLFTLPWLTKVPRITIFFWIIKVGCTTVGETFSDYLNTNLNLGLGGAAGICFPVLIVATWLQMSVNRYIGVLYWFVVVFMSICGTIMTDGFHDNLNVELWIECIVFFILMMVTFGAWLYVEGTLAIHSIYTLRREAFYWMAILWTFSMGTAVGDGISEAWGIGYGATLGLFAGIMAAIVLVWAALLFSGLCDYGSMQEITLFWLAYIMTRPLGASIGDLFSSDTSEGGLGLGTRNTSLILLAIIAVCLLICGLTGYDILKEDMVQTPSTKDLLTEGNDVEIPASRERGL